MPKIEEKRDDNVPFLVLMNHGISKQILQDIVIKLLYQTDFFLVGIDVQGADCFTVKVDHINRSITIDDCVDFSRKIQEQLLEFNPNVDIELTISSSGIGQPLTDIRQLLKLQGKAIEFLPKKGSKIVAILESANNDGTITISYDTKQKVEGKKRPILVKETETLLFTDAVWIKEHI